MDPDFVHHGVGDFPLTADEGKSVRVMIGSLYGQRSPVATTSETVFADATLKSGATLPIDASHEERALYLVSGEIDVAAIALGRTRCWCCGRVTRSA